MLLSRTGGSGRQVEGAGYKRHTGYACIPEVNIIENAQTN